MKNSPSNFYAYNKKTLVSSARYFGVKNAARKKKWELCRILSDIANYEKKSLAGIIECGSDYPGTIIRDPIIVKDIISSINSEPNPETAKRNEECLKILNAARTRRYK